MLHRFIYLLVVKAIQIYLSSRQVDVYKRQLLRPTPSENISWMRAEGMAANSFIAVSYTHLDVYKRQGDGGIVCQFGQLPGAGAIGNKAVGPQYDRGHVLQCNFACHVGLSLIHI